MVNDLKFQTLFFFCCQIKKLVFRAEIHKILVRKANREDPDQSDLGLPCLSGLLWPDSYCLNFLTFTIL